MTRSVAKTAIVCIAMMLFGAPTASAADESSGSDTVYGQVGDSSIVVGRHMGHAGSDKLLARGSGSARERVYLPACQGNAPGAAASWDASCPQALAMCSSTAVPDDLMFWRFEAVIGPPRGPWQRVGSACLRPSQVPGRAVPALSLAEFRRLPLPAGVVHIQPGTLRTLVNIETNVFVSAGPANLRTTLIGQPVRVRATPVGYRWTFGDGGVLNTTDPGGAYPAMTTTHVYRQPGRVPVSLVTRYRGEYSVAGGPWLPVDGEAEVNSPPIQLTVVAARNELVSGPLPEES